MANADGRIFRIGSGSGAKPLGLLLVEDSEDDALLLVRELRRGGYDPTFERVETPEAVTEALAKKRWDIVIADYTMPHFKGTDALEIVRNSGIELPFIFVSGTITEDTAVNAMEAGAYDYLVKGNLKRLIPAIEQALHKAELRRESKRIEEHVKRQQDRIRALYNLSSLVSSTLDLQTVLHLLLERTDLLLSYRIASTIKLFNKEKGQLEPVACRNVGENVWNVEGWKSGRDFAQVVFASKAPLLVSEIQTNPALRNVDFYRQHGLISYLGIPLIAKGEVLGVLGLYTREKQPFSADEIEFLSMLAGQAAVAIHNSQLYEKTKSQALEVQRTNERKTELLGHVSYQLRTQLSTVVGYARMVLDGGLGEVNPSQRNAIGRLLDQAQEVVDTIEILLEADKIEAGAVKTEIHEVRLKRFLDQLQSSYAFPLDREIVLVWDYSSRLPVIKTDESKLKYLLRTLIRIAVALSDQGRVTVSARHFPELRTVVFEVSDTGRGISQDALQAVFEMSRQFPSPADQHLDFPVLGLYIARKLTEVLGGKIEVTGKAGQGSTFTLTLPCELKTPTIPTRS